MHLQLSNGMESDCKYLHIQKQKALCQWLSNLVTVITRHDV
jgi:hypothetical protein